MAYASAQDMKDRYPEKDLREITDEAAIVIDDSRLDSALVDASSQMDGYLRGRYALPLAEVPLELVVVACDMAMYKLQGLRPINDIEDARRRYTDAIRYLEGVSAGRIQLGLSATAQPAQQTDGPIVISARRTFDRTSMRGM
jgi:phage gp36-like protein